MVGEKKKIAGAGFASCLEGFFFFKRAMRWGTLKKVKAVIRGDLAEKKEGGNRW